mgnify:CR=1 FL=1
MKSVLNTTGAIILPPIHLGTGVEGEFRRQALEALAVEAGCEWGGKPSIGRYIVALADAKLRMMQQSTDTSK